MGTRKLKGHEKESGSGWGSWVQGHEETKDS